MIRLHSRHCLVTGADGTVHSLDGDALRHDLRRAFRACGITEDWSADHLALVIEEHVASRPEADHPPLAERDLHAMVLALLPAAGFEDVGRAYADLVPEATMPLDPDPFRPWDRGRIDADLEALLPLAADERAAIAAQTEAALASLRLAQVRSDLIGSLARHFLQRRSAPCPEAATDSPWCLPPGAWPVGAVPDAERLIAAGVLSAFPVSRFLPRLRLELDLCRLAGSSGTPPLAEIVLLPALARALDGVVALFAEAHRAVWAVLPPPERRLPMHLRVRSLDDCVRNAMLPQCPRARKALCHDIRATIEAKLLAAGHTAMLLTFR